MLPSNFRVNWPFDSGEEAKNRFSSWLPRQPSWISDPNDFSYFFYQQITPMLPTKFRVNWPFSSGEEAKNRFSRWPPWWRSWIPTRKILATFDLQVTLMLPTKFHVSWPSWTSDQNHFSYFWSTSHPYVSYEISSQLAFQFRRRSEK